MDSLKIAAQTWAKAVENAKRLHTALTHFFNLPTTAANPENLSSAVSTRRGLAATGDLFT